MSDLTPPSQSDFLKEFHRLHAAQLAAETPEDREMADHDLSMFLRMNAQGRLSEYWARRTAQSA